MPGLGRIPNNDAEFVSCAAKCSSDCVRITSELFECKSREEHMVYKKLNSTGTLIQRTTMEAPQQTYVLHRARRSQEDDQLLHQRCKRADSAGRDDSSDS